MEDIIRITPKNISILGSTGSIGKATLDVVRQSKGKIKVSGLAGGKNIETIKEQVRLYEPEIVSVANPELANQLKKDLNGMNIRIVEGKEGCVEVATLPSVELVVSAISGAIGLIPTYYALLSGKNVALANKESMVTAGQLLKNIAKEKNTLIIPVDSEHNAVFQCLHNKDLDYLDKIILTASGGPFLNYSIDKLKNVTVKDAINHPNWSMGRKISVDSATMMNKGLEIIEAMRLFDMPLEKIDVLIHPQSIVHAMVRFIDGSHIAHLGVSDMRIPISHALSYPERIPVVTKELNLATIGALNFMKPDTDKFPCLRLAIEAAKKGKNAPVILNAANEIAVDFFLDGKIHFTDIALVVEKTIENVNIDNIENLDDVMHWDSMARLSATNIIYEKFLNN
jgi:1-deoxy-D-xylulose-5-phosphate reductoisomerase